MRRRRAADDEELAADARRWTPIQVNEGFRRGGTGAVEDGGEWTVRGTSRVARRPDRG